VTSAEAAVLARRIDLSCVRAQHSAPDVRELAEQALKWGCINAHVLPSWLPLLVELVEGSETLPAAPIGFPSGGSTTETKRREAECVLEGGAREVDVVVNIGRLIDDDLQYVGSELRRVMAVIPSTVVVKGIIETSLLSESQIRRATGVVADAGFAFVKTGTGWAGPVTEEAVATIASELALIGADHVEIKAAGGIRTVSDIRSLTSAGATRFGIGLSSALAILDEVSNG